MLEDALRYSDNCLKLQEGHGGLGPGRRNGWTPDLYLKEVVQWGNL